MLIEEGFEREILQQLGVSSVAEQWHYPDALMGTFGFVLGFSKDFS